MTKQMFLNQLAGELHRMPQEERFRTLSYYDELVDDRIEDGQSEEEAVASLGDPGQVAREILGEEEASVSTKTGRKVWLIVLLVLGFPLWGSLLLAGICLLLSIYLLLFVPTLVLGALALGFLAAAVMGVLGTPFLIFDQGIFAGGLPAGVFQLGLSVALLGLSILSAVGLYFMVKGTVKVSKSLWRWLGRSFKKEGRGAL